MSGMATPPSSGGNPGEPDIPVLRAYPPHLSNVFKGSAMQERQRVHFVEAIGKVNHWGHAQPRVLLLTADLLIVMTMSAVVKRVHDVSRISKITHQRYHHNDAVCVRILVSIPMEKDLMFLLTPRATANGDWEGATKSFLNVVRRIRERHSHRPGSLRWEGIISTADGTDLRESAQLTVSSKSEYLPPRSKMDAILRSRSAPSMRDTTATQSSRTLPGDSPGTTSPPVSPVGGMAHLPSHSGVRLLHEPSVIAASVSDLPPRGRSERGVEGGSMAMDGAPSGLASAKRVKDLEAEVAKLKEELQEKETYAVDLEQHFCAIRATNSWMETQLYEKKGHIEDLEARNSELVRELQAAQGAPEAQGQQGLPSGHGRHVEAQQDENSPTSQTPSEGRSRKVSFVEAASPSTTNQGGDGSERSQLESGGGPDDVEGSAVNASNKALLDEIDFLSTTVEELQRNRLSDDARVKELTTLVNRILAEKSSLVEENTRLVQRLDAKHDDTSQDDLQAMTPRHGLRRIDTAIPQRIAVATQTSPRSPRLQRAGSEGRKPCLPPLVSKDAALDTTTSIESCGSSEAPSTARPPPSAPETGDSEMLRLKAYCDALIKKPTSKSPRSVHSPRQASSRHSDNTVGSTTARTVALLERFAQTDTLMTVTAHTQTEERQQAALTSRAIFSCTAVSRPDSTSQLKAQQLSSDLLLKLAKEQQSGDAKDDTLGDQRGLASGNTTLTSRRDMDASLSCNKRTAQKRAPERATSGTTRPSDAAAPTPAPPTPHAAPAAPAPEPQDSHQASLQADPLAGSDRLTTVLPAPPPPLPQTHSPRPTDDPPPPPPPDASLPLAARVAPHAASALSLAKPHEGTPCPPHGEGSVAVASPKTVASSFTCCSFHAGSPAVPHSLSFLHPRQTSISCESSHSGRSCPDVAFLSKLLDIGMTYDEVETLLHLSIRKKEHLLYVTYEELVSPPCSLPPPLVRRLLTAFGLSYLLPHASRSTGSPLCGGKSPPVAVTQGIARLNTLTASIIDGSFAG